MREVKVVYLRTNSYGLRRRIVKYLPQGLEAWAGVHKGAPNVSKKKTMRRRPESRVVCCGGRRYNY